MMKKRLATILLGAALILGMAVQAEAVSVRHNVTGISWLSGWVDIDNSGPTAPI